MAATSSSKRNQRHALIGKLKSLIKQHGIEDGSEEYRTFLKNYSGKESCGDMTERELSAMLDRIQGKPVRPPLALPVASDRVQGFLPTGKQWRMLHRLSLEAGWDGLNGERMLGHVRHTAKVDALEDCNRLQVSACIKGMERIMNHASGRRRA